MSDNILKEDVLCNMCGLSCLLEENAMGELSGLINQSVSGGYFSTPGNGVGALDDTTNYKFSLCEFCLDWLFSLCKIPPAISFYNDTNDKEEFRPARQRIAEDEWRKETSFAEFRKRDEARKK
jgi:hypothetical protein